MKKVVLAIVALCAAAFPPSSYACDEPAVPIHASATNVALDLGLLEPQIQQILDVNIGAARNTVTFDDVPAIDLGTGQYDYRFADQGVILEGLEGVTQVGGSADSGCVSGGCMDVSRSFASSRVRVHFVEPGTASRTTVARVGAFSTTEDANANCMEFFDAKGRSLGIACMQNPDWSPLTDIEFLGGASCKGIAYVDVFSPDTPFELDLLTYSKHEHDGKCGHHKDRHDEKHNHHKKQDHDEKDDDNSTDD